MLKHPQRLLCLFCAALSGIRLVKWSLLGLSLWERLMQRNTKSWTEVWRVLLPELPVFPLCKSGSKKLLKGQIPKGRLWICHTWPVWCKRKGVAVLQAQALPDAVWISLRFIPIPELHLHPSAVELHITGVCVLFKLLLFCFLVFIWVCKEGLGKERNKCLVQSCLLFGCVSGSDTAHSHRMPQISQQCSAVSGTKKLHLLLQQGLLPSLTGEIGSAKGSVCH